jgi:hypothetical protein
MSLTIRITIGDLEFEAELNDTNAAQAIHRSLPLESSVNRWGDEIYFRTTIETKPDQDMRDIMEPGELAYWPPGKAFCIFWGPTPASVNDEPRAAGDVVPIGQITSNLDALARTRDGQPICIERL